MRKLLFLLSIALFIIFSCSEDAPTEPENRGPKIQSVSASPSIIKIGEVTTFSCVSTDADGDNLTYTWIAAEGSFTQGNSGSSVNWKAPSVEGTYIIGVTVSDGKEIDQDETEIVLSVNNRLFGIVYQKNTSNIINGALIEAGGKSSVSNESGSFSIENIPSGEESVVVTKDGYEIYEEIISITADQPLKHNVFMVGSIMITGKIIDSETKEAISGVGIIINSRVASTDASGNYKFSNFAPGTYSIKVEKENYLSFQDELTLVKDNQVVVVNVVLVPDVVPIYVTYTTIKLWETVGTTSSQLAGLDLSSGDALSTTVSGGVNGFIDIYYSSDGFIVRSANGTNSMTRETHFKVAAGSSLTDGVDSPVKDATWETRIADTESSYVFLYDADGNYSKFKIVNRGGGVVGEPAWVEVSWIYNKAVNSTKF